MTNLWLELELADALIAACECDASAADAPITEIEWLQQLPDANNPC